MPRNPDVEPIPELDNSYFPDDYIEHLETPKDTHAVFLIPPEGHPKVIVIDSDEYNMLKQNAITYVTGTEQSCNEVANTIWETIGDAPK